uniref:Uncharacterized protein n=1 Tax=Anguilla anguilla TaxID=7936 RepID=A0A0E9U3A6_ANGAN
MRAHRWHSSSSREHYAYWAAVGSKRFVS